MKAYYRQLLCFSANSGDSNLAFVSRMLIRYGTERCKTVLWEFLFVILGIAKPILDFALIAS
jgi:hypothetical protein